MSRKQWPERTICLLLAWGVWALGSGGMSMAGTFENPINPGPDPWVQYTDGDYYLATTQGDAVRMWKAPTLAGLKEAEPVTVWTDEHSDRSRGMWAPEFHRIGDRWYLYYTATSSDNHDDNHRMHVLESEGSDPLGPYAYKGRLADPANDQYAIDGSVFRHPGDGHWYFLWAARPGHVLTISRMSNPWTLAGPGVVIPASGFGCEEVREGPVVLRRNGRLFLVYSACDTGKPDYKLGMLIADEQADVMDPAAWKQHPEPVFQRNDEAGVFGPGHNGFFRSPDGTEDWIVYHGKTSSEYTYRGRTTRAQPFTWNPDGTPHFGKPLPLESVLQEPSQALNPVGLRCEYRPAPLGIDEAHPRLSWRVTAPERGARQTAYRILVAESAEALDEGGELLWDSGRVDSDRTVNIVYAGRPLASRMQCYWKVRVWDQDGKATWSAPSRWTMGLLAPEDWRADYISAADREPLPSPTQELILPPARQYRRAFAAAKPVKRATLYVTGLGIYECFVNGRRVGDAWFAPGWTDYHQRAYYWTHDVTDLVQEGDNALAAWVADGWYAGYLGFGLLNGTGPEKLGRYFYGKTPALRAQLEIDYQDGSREVIGTDSSWKVFGDGPIREADFLMGESYDARRETPGWARPGFDDSAWASAILAGENGALPATFYESVNADQPDGPVETKGRPVDLGFRAPPRLEAFPGLPVRVTEELTPVAVTSPADGVHIFNLGQNFAGVVRLKVKGPAGAIVQLRYGEMLHPDGRLMTENLRKARATDRYVLRGDPGGETWTPRFTFHGFQYVEVTGYPGTPDRDAITGLALHSDTPLTSGFACSDPVANRLFQNVVWTQRANFLDLPTDCPQRDERFGWTGDAQIYVRTATFNADVAAFFTKWLRELMESQRPSGTFPGYAPFPFQSGWDFGTAWCDAGVICPHAIWQAYDDTRIIERCWEPMTRFLQWRKDTSRDWLGIQHGNDWGDWLSFGAKTPLAFIDTVYFAQSAGMMAEMARAIGRDDEAAMYDRWVAGIRQAFAAKYLHPDGSLTVDTQTAYVLALAMDLVPDELRPAAGRILAGKLRDGATADNSGMTTGFLGTRPLLPVLSEIGEHDLAVRHFQSRVFPSWGYEVEQGATTIWERWNSYTKENGFGDAGMNSFSHYSFGAVCEWMLDRLAGISPAAPGWQEIVLRPSPPSPGSNPGGEPIHWVRAHHDSIRGRVVCNWRVADGMFELDATIPANTTATVYLPSTDVAGVTEGNRRLEEAPGIRAFGQAGDRTRIEVGAGAYHFRSRWP